MNCRFRSPVLLWMLSFCALLTGCGPHLRELPARADIDLSGQWALTGANRDAIVADLRATIEAADAKQRQRERRRMRHDGPDAEMPMGPPPANEAEGRPAHQDWRVRERQEELDALLHAVVPGKVLIVRQSAPDLLEMQPETGAVRRLDAREGSTLVTRFTTLHIRSGWQSNRFVIYSTDSSQGLVITENYERVGDRLQVDVEFKLSGVKSQTLRLWYRRLA